jgi:cobalamin biosynthesis Mg chelatase CobN
MAKPSQAKAALRYVQRVVEDEYVQEQLRSAVIGARAAYLRARRQRTQVVEDKGLYRNLRQAATALQRATGALRPPPPEPKHRGRKLAVVALAAGGTALITTKLQKLQWQRARNAGTPTPPARAVLRRDGDLAAEPGPGACRRRLAQKASTSSVEPGPLAAQLASQYVAPGAWIPGGCLVMSQFAVYETAERKGRETSTGKRRSGMSTALIIVIAVAVVLILLNGSWHTVSGGDSVEDPYPNR